MTSLLARFHHRADIFLNSCIDLKIYLSEMNFRLGLSTVCIVLLSASVSLQGKLLKRTLGSIYNCTLMFKIICICLGRACV